PPPPLPPPSAGLRVRTVRDLFDGAIFYGRTWDLNSPSAPLVEIPKLTNVEFDDKNKAIISGRAKIRAAPDAPVVESAFKLRTKLGTNGDGRYIKLEEPELAVVLECPQQIEGFIKRAAATLNVKSPKKPEPVVIFVPLGSARKLTQADRDKDGFDLGPDNQISDIWIDNGALRFKLSAMLRPGKFLGNNYLAFSVPIRTFIVTMERVRSGISAARQNKRKVVEEEKKARAAVAQAERERKAFTADFAVKRRPWRRGRRRLLEKERVSFDEEAGVELEEEEEFGQVGGETAFWKYLESFEGFSGLDSVFEYVNRRQSMARTKAKQQQERERRRQETGEEGSSEGFVTKFMSGFSTLKDIRGNRSDEEREKLIGAAVSDWAKSQLAAEEKEAAAEVYGEAEANVEDLN
ncbi:hypothetical protein TeGR_g8327, partial [Tetraparma gracilis]